MGNTPGSTQHLFHHLGPPYPTFQSHLVLLLSDVLLALLLVGDLSHLCIFYHNCKGWSKHSSWSCWIPLVAWPGRDTSGELNHLWILSWGHMDYISFGSFRLVLWHRADIQWFNKGCSLKFHEGSRVRQTPEEGWRIYRLKRCVNDIKMKTIVRKSLMIKIIKLRRRNFDNLSLQLCPLAGSL